MGAQTFLVIEEGHNERAAFIEAVQKAQWEHGHGGYTGTIAEKHEFKVIVPDDAPALFESDKARTRWYIDRAKRYIADDDPRVSNKWGPAGCMVIEYGTYLFFGWASS